MIALVSRKMDEEEIDYTAFVTPDPLPDGGLPEKRVVVCGMSWERYLAFDNALGGNRPGPRLYYLDAELEIMTTSNEHERIRTRLAELMTAYFLEAKVDYFNRGQATMRLSGPTAGAEPDASWCLGVEKEIPDIALEIALTSGGIRKLELYRYFRVPEVWIWRRGGLEMFGFNPSNDNYEKLSTGSRLLPALDVILLEECVDIYSAREAIEMFQARTKAAREKDHS